MSRFPKTFVIEYARTEFACEAEFDSVGNASLRTFTKDGTQELTEFMTDVCPKADCVHSHLYPNLLSYFESVVSYIAPEVAMTHGHRFTSPLGKPPILHIDLNTKGTVKYEPR